MIKARNLEATLPGDNVYLWRLRVTAGAEHHQEGADVWEAMYNNVTTLQEHFYVRERYENVTQLEFEAGSNEECEMDDIPEADQHFFRIVRPLMARLSMVLTHPSSTHPSLTHPSLTHPSDDTYRPLRPPSYVCLWHTRTSVNPSYQWYEYNDNLSEGLPVINDTSTMT